MFNIPKASSTSNNKYKEETPYKIMSINNKVCNTKTGIPTDEKLKSLGLDFVIGKLQPAGGKK